MRAAVKPTSLNKFKPAQPPAGAGPAVPDSGTMIATVTSPWHAWPLTGRLLGPATKASSGSGRGRSERLTLSHGLSNNLLKSDSVPPGVGLTIKAIIDDGNLNFETGRNIHGIGPGVNEESRPCPTLQVQIIKFESRARAGQGPGQAR